MCEVADVITKLLSQRRHDRDRDPADDTHVTVYKPEPPVDVQVLAFCPWTQCVMVSSASAVRLSLQDSVQLDATHFHAAHCFLFCGEKQETYGLMIMRSDGRLGFPGGGVDVICPSELDIVQALNRELMEEINYDARIGLQHYLMSHLHLNVKEGGRSLVTHFFIRNVPAEDEFCRITRDYVKAPSFPEEVLGLFRVPVFPQEETFFANFSKHRFAGNAGHQLLEALETVRRLSD